MSGAGQGPALPVEARVPPIFEYQQDHNDLVLLYTQKCLRVLSLLQGKR
jgi:hypothetical protein